MWRAAKRAAWVFVPLPKRHTVAHSDRVFATVGATDKSPARVPLPCRFLCRFHLAHRHRGQAPE